MQDFEKLGVFYLGRAYDLAAKKGKDELVLYDSKDLVTHAVCVGMTGSGKTGLCIAILEEAAIDGIPAIVIDPKGDLSNLLLTFPQLRPEDFRPWINEDDARRKGVSPDDYAKQQAEMWKSGLAQWGEDGARIQRLRDAADFAIYTPGSNAGIPVSILKSFAAPGQEIVSDGELLRDRVSTTATSLLGLLGIDADPIQSREHILISTLLANAWQQGKDLDLASLIQQIQQPPVNRVGVLDLESFFASKDRFGFAMKLNNLLASPGFNAWLEGEALDIGQILHTPAGKPRVAIFSVAHLGDAERMFFVSLLLNQVLGWMRQQSGTTSLRALVYMDEIFGYFPPSANPPSKRPLLTLMKQARAFGVGVVLATQNPVDLDYKGLSNAGTWFVGRLQTDRDKQRLLDGLEGAAAEGGGKFDRAAMERTLASLGNRVFLMNNVHEDRPEVFESRWALSYLRGPLTRDQIKTLMDAAKKGAATSASTAAAMQSAPAPAASPFMPAASAPAASAAAFVPSSASSASARPVLDPAIQQYFLPVRANPPAAGASLVYRPMLFGCAKVYFADPKAGVDQEQDVSAVAPFGTGPVALDWTAGEDIDLNETDLERDPDTSAASSFGSLPSDASKAKSYEPWKKAFSDWLFRGRELKLFRSAALSQMSKPGESERDFRVRLQQAAREQRDAAVEKLRQRYAPKLASLQDRIRRAQAAVDREKEQASASKWQTAISIGSTVLGAVFGRKTLSAGNIGRATTAARGASRAYKESRDVSRADDNVEAIQQQFNDLQAQFDAESQQVAAANDPATEQLETVTMKPKKTNVGVKLLVLAWAPQWQVSGGEPTPAWK